MVILGITLLQLIFHEKFRNKVTILKMQLDWYGLATLWASHGNSITFQKIEEDIQLWNIQHIWNSKGLTTILYCPQNIYIYLGIIHFFADLKIYVHTFQKNIKQKYKIVWKGSVRGIKIGSYFSFLILK